MSASGDSQPGSSGELPPPQRVANLIGTLIAIVTLVLPLLVILQDSYRPPRVPQTPDPIPGQQDS